MKDYDYIITFDENGQSYIEHFSISGAYGAAKNQAAAAYNRARGVAVGVGRGVRQNHKYIAKIGNRYIYDAKELAAAKANQFKSATKKTASNAKNTINRNNAMIRSRVNSARANLSNTVNTTRDRAVGVVNNAKKKANDIGDEIGYGVTGARLKSEKVAKKISDVAKDKAYDVSWAVKQNKLKKHAAQEARKKKRAEMYNEVKLSTFLTGGDERKEYVQNKRATRDAEREVRKKRRKAERAARRAENIPKQYKGAEAGQEGAKRRQEARDAQEDLVRAAKIAGTRQTRTEDAERRYEETSAPGAVHKAVRKTKNTVNDLVDRVSSTPVYVAKNNTQNPHSGLKLEKFGTKKKKK